MKRMLLAAALGFGLLGGTASAQDAPPRFHGGMGLTRADANGDGVVTRDEYLTQADQRFARMDANNDGKLTGDEMMPRRRFHADNGAPPPPPQADRPPMAHADADGNGVVTREEFRAAALTRFDRLDANRDGRIDQAEMASTMQHFRGRRGVGGDAPPPPPAGDDAAD